MRRDVGGTPRPFATAPGRPAVSGLGPWTYTVVGVLLAIMGFAGVLVFAHGGGGGSTTPVVVAAHDIQLRSPITADDIRVQQYDVNNVPPGVFTSTKAVVGQIAAVAFTTGQPILQNLVSSSPSTVVASATSYLPIAHGFVALTIPSAEQQAVGGYIQAGDYISVIAVVTPRGSTYPEARTIFTNLHVIRTGPANPSTSSSTSGTLGSQTTAGVSSSLTVIVSECDAEYLSWFINYAQLKYTLESYQDYAPQSTFAQPDASCPSVTAAKGVTANDVQRRWPGLLTG